MIRYPITPAQLRQRIQQNDPQWLRKAQRSTARFRKLKKYRQHSPYWSQIKPVFIRLQGGKCAFCERKLEEGQVGNIEWDVEHFRPKSRVELWPPPTLALGFTFPLGPASSKGYYLLPYNFLNYAASCKPCNSPLKRDFFPIAAKRRSVAEPNPKKLLKEKPYLIYPIDTLDDDPETLLTFQGYLCVPVAERGHDRHRALVTIAFFQLNERDTLLKERAEAVVYTWAMLERLKLDPNDELGLQHIARIRMPEFRHANCARSFVRVYYSDLPLAELYVEKARDYLEPRVN